LIIEVHSDPSETHSDGAQAILPETFGEIARDAQVIAGLDGRTLRESRALRWG
jgi:3-deoxy-D-arabino-heptulosonate 7-phosphate (DAHP) synthase